MGARGVQRLTVSFCAIVSSFVRLADSFAGIEGCRWGIFVGGYPSSSYCADNRFYYDFFDDDIILYGDLIC